MLDTTGNYSSFWLLLQLAMHLMISASIVLWNEPDRRYKPTVSVIAWLMAGSSAASALYIVMNWQHLQCLPAQPWPTLFVCIVLIGVIKSNGNLARFIRT